MRLLLVLGLVVQTGCAISYTASDKDGRMTTLAFGLVAITEMPTSAPTHVHGLSVTSIGISGLNSPAGSSISLGYNRDTVFAIQNGATAVVANGERFP